MRSTFLLVLLGITLMFAAPAAADLSVGDAAPPFELSGSDGKTYTLAAGVCHSDLHFVEGSYPYMLPTVLGHESAGIVEEKIAVANARVRLRRTSRRVIRIGRS